MEYRTIQTVIDRRKRGIEREREPEKEKKNEERERGRERETNDWRRER